MEMGGIMNGLVVLRMALLQVKMLLTVHGARTIGICFYSQYTLNNTNPQSMRYNDSNGFTFQTGPWDVS